MKCVEARASVHAYVDGELAESERSEFEEHARTCETCGRLARGQAHFKAALRVALPRRPASAAFRQRLDESLRSEAPPRKRLWGPVQGRGARVLPVAALAAAAAVALVVGVKGRGRMPALPLQTAQALFRADPPPDVRGPHCDEMAAWLRSKVQFPVSLPNLGPGYRCRGGRLVTVGDRPAANLVFEAPNGHLVSYLLYDARNEPPTASEIVRPKNANRDIYIDQAPGLTTAAYRDSGGLGTVITSDMNRDSLIQLASFGSR